MKGYTRPARMLVELPALAALACSFRCTCSARVLRFTLREPPITRRVSCLAISAQSGVVCFLLLRPPMNQGTRTQEALGPQRRRASVRDSFPFREDSMKHLASGLSLAAAFFAFAPSALAQTEGDTRSFGNDPAPAGGVADRGTTATAPVREKTVVRYDISPLFIAGWTTGVGGGLQLDGSVFALRGSFGYAPVFAAIGETPEGDVEDFEVLHSYQANADLLLFFWAPSDHSRIGVSGGYRYSNVLGHGAAWGLEVEADVNDHMTLLLSLSTAYFPDGTERALDALGNPNEPVEFMFGSNFVGGLSIGMRLPI